MRAWHNLLEKTPFFRFFSAYFYVDTPKHQSTLGLLCKLFGDYRICKSFDKNVDPCMKFAAKCLYLMEFVTGEF